MKQGKMMNFRTVMGKRTAAELGERNGQSAKHTCQSKFYSAFFFFQASYLEK